MKKVIMKIQNISEPMVFHIFEDIAPISSQNFLELVNSGFYNGLTFHRIIRGFMIQGGDPTGNGTGGSEKNILGEFTANGIINPLGHYRGVLSMARANDFNSASSQFFICHADSHFLNGNYAAFGVLVSGYSTLDTIANVQTNERDFPINPVIIEYAKIEEQFMHKLTEYANRYLTDKGSHSLWDTNDSYGHNFTEFYGPYFDKYIGKHPKIFEIGVLCGASLEVWNDFFEGDCEIYAIDTDLSHNEYKASNVHIFQCDQNNVEQLREVLNKIGNIKFDIIIDDGSHISSYTLTSLKELYKSVNKDGIYIIEDLHTYCWDRYISDSMLYHLTFFDDGFPKELTDAIKSVNIINRNREAYYKSKVDGLPEDKRSVAALLTFFENGEEKDV